MDIKPVRAQVYGQAPAVKPSSIADTLRKLAGRLDALLAAPDPVASLAAIQELRDVATSIAPEGAPVMHKWVCRKCGKTILEHSVKLGNVYKYCDHCKQPGKPKVLNVLIDGVPQQGEG